MNGSYDPLLYDGTMATAIETAYGLILTALVVTGIISAYTVDAGATITTATVTAVGQVHVEITLTDPDTSGVATYVTAFGGSAVDANSN